MKCLTCKQKDAIKYSRYSNGNFCSRSCARAFSTKEKRKKINNKISKKLKGRNDYIWNKTDWDKIKICSNPDCKKEFVAKGKLQKCCSRKCGYDNIKYSKHFLERDMSIANKKAYKNGRQVSGGTTKWYTYKNIKVQGTYELRTCKILDEWKKKKQIKDWEYTKDRYQYIGVDKKKHQYLLDFKIFDNTGKFYYIETKGYIRENDEIKWRTVRNLGYKLEVWFVKTINTYEKEIKIYGI